MGGEVREKEVRKGMECLKERGNEEEHYAHARPRGTDSAKVIQVIETIALRGSGSSQEDPVRRVKQYWSLDGEMLAEKDMLIKENE